MSAVETAEICSKALDWKTKTSPLGEIVASTYLLFVEEVARGIDRALESASTSETQVRAQDYKRKVHQLLSEVYKRLLDEKSIMGINTELSNIDLPGVKSTAVLLLAKYWDPQVLDTKMSEADAQLNISFLLVSFVIVHL